MDSVFGRLCACNSMELLGLWMISNSEVDTEVDTQMDTQNVPEARQESKWFSLDPHTPNRGYCQISVEAV